MSTENDNRMRWDRQRRGHYEVWYSTFNHRPTQTGFWIRHTLDVPAGKAEATCGIWFAFFDARSPQESMAYHRTLPVRALAHDTSPFHLSIGPSVLEHGALAGRLCEGDAACIPLGRGDDPRVETIPDVNWNLRFPPSSFSHRHLPPLMTRRELLPIATVLPSPMTNYSGIVNIGDKSFALEDEPGCQGHLWGRSHPRSWAWAHCNGFREDSTANLEVLSLKLRYGPISLPGLTLVSLYLGREVYHFREPWTAPLTRAEWRGGRLRFSATGLKIKILGEINCRPTDLVRCDYQNPNGSTVFCHNTEVANATVNVFQRRSTASRFRKYIKLTSRATTHFEFGGRVADAAVEARHQVVGRPRETL
ncbi:MAG: hypothetical protein JRH20_14560 [Deltaproteobacteria bacterium]|nr:hypothetical protein [Deltaproteobacteria bacterium]